jgi:nitrite reductase (NADH) small subunit
VTMMIERTSVEVCNFDEVLPERGVRALVGGRHVAVFRTWDGDVHALDAVDPFSGASVLSRGIVGTIGGAPVVASPMYKQRFDLTTGVCLDDPSVSVRVYRAAVVEGRIVIDGA